jgi:hypothetical protein
MRPFSSGPPTQLTTSQEVSLYVTTPFPFTLLCGNVFSLLHYRGNATMPHHPIVVQQEAEVMLPRKPNMWQYNTVIRLRNWSDLHNISLFPFHALFLSLPLSPSHQFLSSPPSYDSDNITELSFPLSPDVNATARDEKNLYGKFDRLNSEWRCDRHEKSALVSRRMPNCIIYTRLQWAKLAAQITL